MTDEQRGQIEGELADLERQLAEIEIAQLLLALCILRRKK